MSLPRMRITVGQMLIVVVVLALNCGVLRHFHERIDSLHPRRLYFLGHAPPFESMELLLPRFLPLINLALIGILSLAVRRLGAARRGSVLESESTSAWKGVVFFSLHFLVLGAVVGLFLSGVTELRVNGPEERIDPDSLWVRLQVFYSGEGGEAWRLFEILIVGLVFSGPFLLLSWIGGVLARRSASTLPAWRFRMLAGLVSLGFGMVALALGLTPRSFHEEKSVRLEFVVMDKDSGRPINSAFVRLVEPIPRGFGSEAIPRCDFTTNEGRASLTDSFVAAGQNNAFRTMGLFSPWGRWLEVSADQYQTLRIPLIDVVEPVTDLENPRPGKVELVKGRTTTNSCEDLAGTYHTAFTGFGGETFEIQPDGRFFWYSSGCLGIYGGEFGHVKRGCGEIEYVAIPHPGHEPSWERTTRWCVVKWDGHRYLSTTAPDELQMFCRSMLTPSQGLALSCGYHHPGYLLVTGCEKPPRGVPRLPAKIWLGFLLDEISLQNEDGLIRRVLVSLILSSPFQSLSESLKGRQSQDLQDSRAYFARQLPGLPAVDDGENR
jgi:hypothetical protein